MHTIVLDSPTDMPGWRTAARRLAAAGIPPEAVVWSVRGEPGDLLAAAGSDTVPEAETASAFSVPRRFLALAENAILARDPERFALLYRLLWRLARGERGLLDDPADPDLSRAEALAAAVRRAIHRMHAFVRFRSIEVDGNPQFIAWFEPEHHVLEAAAPFFVRRFAATPWSILTPDRSVHWDGLALHWADGARRSAVPDRDALEAYWRTYYRSIFNPARLNVAKMTADMPKRYWRNLPEAALIPDLVREAPARVEAMVAAAPRTVASAPRQAETSGRAPTQGLAAVAREAAGCRACPLWERATRTVFGEGPADAEIMIVGEQPGDQEDLTGRPFVGPAGQLFDAALTEAGLDRQRLYVTNAVKHFKFEPRGKRRIHQKPAYAEIVACGPWLERERQLVRPKLLLLMGATAAQAVLARPVAVMRERGRIVELAGGAHALVTVHPSYLLRLPDEAQRAEAFRAFVADLRRARTFVSLAHDAAE